MIWRVLVSLGVRWLAGRGKNRRGPQPVICISYESRSCICILGFRLNEPAGAGTADAGFCGRGKNAYS
jgi:hypothetical protein